MIIDRYSWLSWVLKLWYFTEDLKVWKISNSEKEILHFLKTMMCAIFLRLFLRRILHTLSFLYLRKHVLASAYFSVGGFERVWPTSPQLNSLQSCCCLDCIRDVHSIEHYLMQLRAAAVVIKRNSYQFKFGPGHMNNVWDLLIWEAYTLTFWYGWPMPTWYWDKQLQAASGQLLPCLLLVMSPRRKK